MEVINQNQNQNIGTGGASSNLPEKKFQIGGISATVWKNETTNKDGQPVSYRTVSFERNYRDKDGNWKPTSSLRINDIPKASLVLNKAYEYINMAEN
ncbi:MAG: hypothetical protein ACLFPQ_02715 [Candidatus Woesearchaeota archaeon]